MVMAALILRWPATGSVASAVIRQTATGLSVPRFHRRPAPTGSVGRQPKPSLAISMAMATPISQSPATGSVASAVIRQTATGLSVRDIHHRPAPTGSVGRQPKPSLAISMAMATPISQSPATGSVASAVIRQTATGLSVRDIHHRPAPTGSVGRQPKPSLAISMAMARPISQSPATGSVASAVIRQTATGLSVRDIHHRPAPTGSVGRQPKPSLAISMAMARPISQSPATGSVASAVIRQTATGLSVRDIHHRPAPTGSVGRQPKPSLAISMAMARPISQSPATGSVASAVIRKTATGLSVRDIHHRPAPTGSVGRQPKPSLAISMAMARPISQSPATGSVASAVIRQTATGLSVRDIHHRPAPTGSVGRQPKPSLAISMAMARPISQSPATGSVASAVIRQTATGLSVRDIHHRPAPTGSVGRQPKPSLAISMAMARPISQSPATGSVASAVIRKTATGLSVRDIHHRPAPTGSVGRQPKPSLAISMAMARPISQSPATGSVASAVIRQTATGLSVRDIHHRPAPTGSVGRQPKPSLAISMAMARPISQSPATGSVASAVIRQTATGLSVRDIHHRPAPTGSVGRQPKPSLAISMAMARPISQSPATGSVASAVIRQTATGLSVRDIHHRPAPTGSVGRQPKPSLAISMAMARPISQSPATGSVASAVIRQTATGLSVRDIHHRPAPTGSVGRQPKPSLAISMAMARPISQSPATG